MTKRKIKTMEELSEAIGVSRPTLSKYFQDPTVVRKSTKAKIEGALSEVDYVPNFFATRLNRTKTRLIGVIVPHLNDMFYTNLIQIIEQAAFEEEFTIITQSSHGSQAGELRAIENLRSMNVDGAIIAPIGKDSDRATFRKLNSELPLVLLDSVLPGVAGEFSFVGTDNNQSVRLLVDYLCRSGQPPVFLGTSKVNENSSQRENAYANRMIELGHTPEHINRRTRTMPWEFEDFAYRLFSEKLADGLYHDATILCANDRVAMGALRAANEHGLFEKSGQGNAAPFRLAGHDNHPLSAFLWPSLTTASQNTEQIGVTAFRTLVEKMDNKTRNRTQLFEAQLVLRDSA
ncbi:MAG: LacI family DNA-binding transcriptional regulator [Stappiaceae bacterium]